MADILGTIGTVLDVLNELNAKQSTIVTITNDTGETLRLIPEEDNHESGEFATLPAESIPTDEEDVFGSKEKSPSFFTGDVGHVQYRIGDTETAFLRIDWSNPAVGDPFEDKANNATAVVGGSDRDRFETLARITEGSEKVDARFAVRLKGRPTPPTPKPGGEDNEIKSTCVITVTNQSESALTLVDQGHEIGGFFTFPAVQIEPGESDSFASVETEGSDAKGSRGFLVYNAGEIGACQWTVTWDNPEQADNSSTSTLAGPEAPTFQALDQIGAGEENVPVTFTIFGGQRRVDPPIDPPIDPPVDPFVRPVETDEPTLRHGDQSVDGWVEYLQQLLNAWSMGPIAEDGDFGGGTLQAVRNFQASRQPPLLVDGVVGNQTWASLREEDPRPPSTDGLEPHSFVERGAEARWITEDHGVQYDPARDVLFVIAVSTGDTPIESDQFRAHLFVTVPSGEQVEFDLPGQTTDGQPTEQGGRLFFGANEVRQRAGPGTYQVQAFLPQELGGDESSRTIEIV